MQSSEDISSTFCLMLDSLDVCHVAGGLSLEEVCAILAVSWSRERTGSTVKLINIDVEIARFNSAINMSLSGLFFFLRFRIFYALLLLWYHQCQRLQCGSERAAPGPVRGSGVFWSSFYVLWKLTVQIMVLILKLFSLKKKNIWS